MKEQHYSLMSSMIYLTDKLAEKTGETVEVTSARYIAPLKGEGKFHVVAQIGKAIISGSGNSVGATMTNLFETYNITVQKPQYVTL